MICYDATVEPLASHRRRLQRRRRRRRWSPRHGGLPRRSDLRCHRPVAPRCWPARPLRRRARTSPARPGRIRRSRRSTVPRIWPTTTRRIRSMTTRSTRTGPPRFRRDVGITPYTATTGANYGNHVHRGAVDLVTLDDDEGPFASSAADNTIVSYTLAANTAEARMRFLHFYVRGDLHEHLRVRRGTFSMKVKVGGTTFLTHPADPVRPPTPTLPFVGDAELIFRTIGATASVDRLRPHERLGRWRHELEPGRPGAVGTATARNTTGSLAIAAHVGQLGQRLDDHPHDPDGEHDHGGSRCLMPVTARTT